MTTKKITKYC